MNILSEEEEEEEELEREAIQFDIEVCSPIRVAELKDSTLHCIRIWFGSGLDFFQWKLLQEDVVLNSSSPIPASLPFARYRHILVFDPKLVINEPEIEEIYRLCDQRNIYPLPLDLYRVLPYSSKHPNFTYPWRLAKNRLQCLFAHYLKHVALFDFDVRLKRPIHSMLVEETQSSSSSSSCCCLVSTSNGGRWGGSDIRTNAFVNIHNNNDDDDTRLLKDANLKFYLYDCDSLVKSAVGVGVIKSIDKYVTACPNRVNVGRFLFKNTERNVLLRDMILPEGVVCEDLDRYEQDRYERILDANIFHPYVIEAPQEYRHCDNGVIHSDTIFKKPELNDTLYFLRMWFGSDLDDFQWRLLLDDVSRNSSSLIPSWLPFKRYVHVLVFDSSLVTEKTATNIWFKCKEFGIHPLDIDLYRVIPFSSESSNAVTLMHRFLARAKDRLQCLFAFYLNHVALFDFDVRLEIPIHQMLVMSHILYEAKCMADKPPIIPRKTINSCLVPVNNLWMPDLQLDAFVNVRLNDVDDMLVADFKERTRLHVDINRNLYVRHPFSVNLINDYVRRCPVGISRSEIGRILFSNERQRFDLENYYCLTTPHRPRPSAPTPNSYCRFGFN